MLSRPFGEWAIKLNFKKVFLHVSRVMNIWQIAFFAVVSWMFALFLLRTMYLWLVAIRDDSVVLKGLSDSFVRLFGKTKYTQLRESIGFGITKYIVVLLLAILIFYLFYRFCRHQIFKKQLRTINFALREDRPVDTASYVKDIQELEENIENMRKRQRVLMEQESQAQKAKNDLITNVSHDLRTPLTSILGYLSFIHEDRYRDEIELRYYTELVYGKAKHLHKLIDDLFSYTRLESTEYPLKHDTLDMNELLSQLVLEFEAQAAERKIKINESYQLDKLIVTGDGNQIMRLFENLFSNALRYGENELEIVARKEEEMAVVEVSNYGEEIPAIDLPYLFDRFYKVDKNRTTTGTGLGLAIAKSIVEKHGGIVTAESKNRKTTFIVKLPLAEQQSRKNCSYSINS